MANLYYFEHLISSRNDLKLIALDDELGQYVGYALYFQTLEVMLESDGYGISESRIGSIARVLFTNPSTYARFIDLCLESGLFVNEAGRIYSKRFIEWASKKESAYKRNVENGKLGGRPRRENKTEPEPDHFAGLSNMIETKQPQKSNLDHNHIAEANKMVETNPKSKIDKSAEERQVFDHWNAKGIVKHGSITKDLKQAIDKAVSAYGSDKICLAIDAYDEFREKTDWYNHRWTLLEFLKRKNGLPIYLDKAVNAIEETKQKSQETAKNDAQRDEAREARKRLVSEMNASPWHGFGSLRELLSHCSKFPDKESKFAYIETMPERMQKIVTAPASGMIRVLKEGINPNLEAEFQAIKEKNK